MDEQVEFAAHLRNSGLEETEFWLTQLNKKLGVKSKSSLDLLQGKMDSFSALKEVAKCQEEVEALKKLFKIEGQKVQKLRECDEKLHEEIHERDEEFHECTEEFHERKEELEIHEHEEDLHECEEECEQRAWRILKEDRNSFEDSMLLQRVSGGRALQGILLTQQNEDKFTERERLLEAPKEVVIAVESFSEQQSLNFSSECQENSFKKAVAVLGHSAAVSANIPLLGGSIDATSNRAAEVIVQGENYSSTVKYFYVDVASYSFRNKDLKLSEDSKIDLHKVLKLFKEHGAESDYVKEACEQFFLKYGSHVCRGPLKFGGNFLWSCSSRGFSHPERKAVENMQYQAISAHTGITFAGTDFNIDKIKESYQVQCSESARASTQFQVRLNGGPTEATSLSVWLTGLVTDTSTWLLTDRGKTIPVWDIIRKNHNDLQEMREVLQTTWEKMSGLKVEQSLLAKLSYDSEAVLEVVDEWTKENLLPQKIEDNLAYLCEVKKDIIDKTGNVSIWISEYLSGPILQTFLVSVVDLAHTSAKFECVKYRMNLLVESDELSTFPRMEKVSKWISVASKPRKPFNMPKDIPDFESLDFCLSKALDQERLDPFTSGKLFSTKYQEVIAEYASKAITLLRFHYQHTYNDILITILVHPFQSDNCGNVIALNPMSLKDLELLRKYFSEQKKLFNQYMEKKRPVHLQAYLFELAVTLFGETEEMKFQQFLNQIAKMMRAFHPPLEQELEECLDNFIATEEFKGNLQNLLADSRPPLPTTYSKSHSLRDVLKTEACKHRELFDDHSLLFESNPTVHSLFVKLGLDKLYSKKLQLKDAVCVTQDLLHLSLKKIHPTGLEKLPFLVLHKLMAYDVNCRSDLMSEDGSHSKLDGYDDADDDGDDDDDDGDDDNKPCDSVHPVDVLLALIHCSDDFLRQDLFSRLAKCQLSVPFILPDPFTKQLTIQLWALRSIIKEWKCTNSGGDVVQHSISIVNYPMPIVSFICFQKHKSGKSKSFILNEVMSDSECHFFHRDCSGGQCKSLLGDGLVDMSWYLPTGEADADTFPNAITFLNLHGDARQHPQQSKFLSQISFACVVLLTEEVTESDKGIIDILKMFSSSPGGILLLDNIGKMPKTVLEEIPDVNAINLTKKNVSKIKDSIRNYIKAKLQANVKQFETIEESCKLKQEKVFIDEDSYYHRKGWDLAHEIKLNTTTDEADTKENILPLQGKFLWQDWAAQDRELHRQIHRGNRTVSEYTELIKNAKKIVRKKQEGHIESLTPAIKSFITLLLKLGGTSNVTLRNYFLHCLKLDLDNRSRKKISIKQHEYEDTKRKLAKLKNEAEEEIKQHKSRMETLHRHIVNASFGLEHLIREVGQVYEAAVESPNYGSELSRIPKAAAELLIDGYSLEVMDGDAAHVPLKWVAAVFNEALKMLDDPKVFVLSVVGIQSTGKSTMLNTVFGLQFNVGAGRCTRGAFIQLLPLNINLRKKTGCSYILVVDTEGMRPPDINPIKMQKHDNELATLVIGLANMTLINIYGEVPGDMDDILQTSVHAFLRMTQVNIFPSCQFVHQNAESNIKSEGGRMTLTQKLDKFTVDAAREEHCEGQYKTFNQVIRFNDQKDLHHFPALWKGNPPMAPVNQGYSRSSQMLKDSFINVLNGKLTNEQIRLSSFCKRIDDIWNAVLKEDFVFSFRNTMEIIAYNSLETEFGMWKWTFQDGMQKWEQKVENEIRATKPQAVPELVKRKREDLKTTLKELYESLESKMVEFFRTEILAQWKEKFERQLLHLRGDLWNHAETHCTTLLQSKMAISKFEDELNKNTKRITEKVQEIIASIKRDQEKLEKNLGDKKLETWQLKEILDRELFTLEKLALYERKALITPQQVSHLKEVTKQKLTVGELNTILVGGTLGMDEVKEILKMGHTEEQLKMKFDQVWTDLVQQQHFVMPEQISVEAEVETRLTGFVYDSSRYKLIELLQRRSLAEVASLDIFLERGRHYTVHPTFFSSVVRKMTSTGRLEDSEAQEITERIFNAVKNYLAKLEKRNTDFSTAFVSELLHMLEKRVCEETRKVKRRLIFTSEYKLDIFFTACGYAIPKFKKMREAFRERHDLHLYLERHIKGPLFTKFKDQYYQAEAEESIANSLCAYAEEPIIHQVTKNLGSKMIGMMKDSDKLFSSKMALKVKVLTDLFEEDAFGSYIHYVDDPRGHLEETIKKCTIKFCDEAEHGKNTKLQATAKNEATRIINVFKEKINHLDEPNVRQWVTVLSEDADIKGELGVALDVDAILDERLALEKLDLKNFKQQFKSGLKNLESRLHASFDTICCDSTMDHWLDGIHALLESLIGCTEQCPFCGEQCDLLDPNHVATTGRPHSASVHRSNCLKGYHNLRTEIIGIGFCPSYISGNEDAERFKNADTNYEWHPYKDYRLIYPNWSIPPDITSEDSLYWKMFVGKYMETIAELYGAKPAEVPENWLKITCDEVQESLRSQYNC